MPANFRIAIVGAASIHGKELNEALSESGFAASEFILLDDEEALGQIAAAGEEAAFIQKITPRSFDRADFVFFASRPDVTQRNWHIAQRAGASVVDLSYALEDEPGVLVRSSWIQRPAAGQESREQAADPKEMSRAPRGDDAARRSGAAFAQPSLSLRTPAVVSAHPAAVALALLAKRLQSAGAVRSFSATVLEPASEHGNAAMDELHQQTVALLSFKTLPKAVYDTQVAFNAVVATGEEAKVDLAATESRIRRHYALLSAGALPRMGIQLVHLPVFHGQGFSIVVEFDRPAVLERVETELSGPHVEVATGEMEMPSNLTSAGQHEILVRVRPEEQGEAASMRFWLWAYMDNLKIAAANAVECAQEMRKLRPQGKVQ